MDRTNVRPCRRPIWAAALLVVLTPARVLALDAGAPNDREPIAALLAKVIPTVVAVHTRRDISAADMRAAKTSTSPKIERAEGSGFIVSADGFIATNKHVVHGAYAITVSMYDGRTVDAKIVWESSVVDVAFLKIAASRPLQAASLSRDYGLQLGRRVVAIGNPLGLGISASAGIVSALDRNLTQTPYDSYIQTDAAINNGNSGGPLFDLDGEVVGMNSILWTLEKGQGSQGLGFAIPGSDISFLIDQLRRNGHIACGTIGLRGQRLTPAMGEAVGFSGDHGVIVAEVDDGAPAARAGLRMGDILVSFDGRPLYDVTTLNRATCLALGHTARVELVRDGRPLALETQVAQDTDGKVAPNSDPAAPRFASARDLGLDLAPITPKTRRQYHLPASVHGYVVLSVADSSEGEIAGLAPGDVILRLQMDPLSGAQPFDRLFVKEGRRGRRHVILLVEANGETRWITFPVRLADTP